MTRKYMFLDFEFNSMSEPHLNLVSCALELQEDSETVYRENFWLLDPLERLTMSRLMYRLLPEYIVVAYALQAEARCLFDLCPSLVPEDIIGLDLYLNYRMLLNHNDKLSYGKQLIRGVEKVTRKPPSKYARTQEELQVEGHKPEHTLVAACYKLLDVRLDAAHKDLMRDIIIEGDPAKLEANKQAILDYGESDIRYLPRLLKAQIEHMMGRNIPRKQIDFAWLRLADFAVRAAWMERIGYPVRVGALKRFVSHIPDILEKAAETVNIEHPEIAPFVRDKKTKIFVKKEKPIKDWVIANHDVEKDWILTNSGLPSLSIEAFRRFYDSQDVGFGGSMVRYLKTKQSLNGFSSDGAAKGRRKSFFDCMGSDGRARFFSGIYGSQTSRSQPAATGFLPLKAHWMRWFIQPKEGRAILGLDYASQEFLIAALLSSDPGMTEAYRSGDVYLAFGKASGQIPADATKDSHKKERDVFKTLVLAISYDMSATGLAKRLAQKFKEDEWTIEKAQKLIEAFYKTYSSYARWKQKIQYRYNRNDNLALKDGWLMFGDNDNSRSVGNFPVQGAGAAIMREAVKLAQKAGLDVIFTLHDALYIEFPSMSCAEPLILKYAMHKAFVSYFDGMFGPNPGAELIRLDGFQWSPDYAERLPKIKEPGVTYSPYYMDERGLKDFNTYRHYFDTESV